MKVINIRPATTRWALVAQLDRALASGAKGLRFESCRARQLGRFAKVTQYQTKFSMVAIAQLVEPRIVIPVVVSSSLISHPIILTASSAVW